MAFESCIQSFRINVLYLSLNLHKQNDMFTFDWSFAVIWNLFIIKFIYSPFVSQ